MFRGAGGEKPAKERRIDENEGISILRAGRENFFGYFPGVQPSVHKVDIDRWIGVEIRFTPELDECFQVSDDPQRLEPQLHQYRVLEPTGLHLPVGAFKDFWQQLMGAVEMRDAFHRSEN